MPIKLGQPTHELNNGKPIFKQDVKDMVTGYRNNHINDRTKPVKFIHFNLNQVLLLFIDNKILDPSLTINDQLKISKEYGMKIYLGNHLTLDTCPPDIKHPGQNDKRYLNMDNAIVCATYSDVENPSKKFWRDNLIDNKENDNNAILITGVSGTGEALDRGTVCEPDCANMIGPDGYVQTDIFS